MLQVVAIPYRRFGTTLRPHLQGSRIRVALGFLTLEDGADELSGKVGNELPLLAA